LEVQTKFGIFEVYNVSIIRKPLRNGEMNSKLFILVQLFQKYKISNIVNKNKWKIFWNKN
jgi:hypothetical protein